MTAEPEIAAMQPRKPGNVWSHQNQEEMRKELLWVCSMANTFVLDFWPHNCRKSIAVGVSHLVCGDLL